MLKRLFGSRNKKKTAELDTNIDKYLTEFEENSKNRISLLLLGCGSSGKSTLFTQMQKIYRKGIRNSLLKDCIETIRSNIFNDIYELSRQNKKLRENYNNSEQKECDKYLSSLICNNIGKNISVEYNIYIPIEIVNIIVAYYNYCPLTLSTDKVQSICDQMLLMKPLHTEETLLTTELAKDILILWNDRGLQETYKRQSELVNTPFFMSKIVEISQNEFNVTFEDYIRLKHSTHGIIESRFDLDILHEKYNKNWKMCVTDMCGERWGRKRWLSCFDDINAIIWVMALDGYDKVLREDNDQNCYQEAFAVFDKTCKYEKVKTMDFFVILNKYGMCFNTILLNKCWLL